MKLELQNLTPKFVASFDNFRRRYRGRVVRVMREGAHSSSVEKDGSRSPQR